MLLTLDCEARFPSMASLFYRVSKKMNYFDPNLLLFQYCYPPRSVNGYEQLSEGLTNSQELAYHGQSIEERFDLLRWRKMSSSDAQILLTNLSECQIKTLKGVKKKVTYDDPTISRH